MSTGVWSCEIVRFFYFVKKYCQTICHEMGTKKKLQFENKWMKLPGFWCFRNKILIKMKPSFQQH